MNKGLKIFLFGLLGVFFVVLLGYVTMMLWNWLVPALFAGPVITFWQALGLWVLSKILFGGFGGKRWGGGGHYSHSPWKQHYYQKKMSGMTPEDRDRFKKKMWEKWCVKVDDASEVKTPTSND
jgi:hypothetical protein